MGRVPFRCYIYPYCKKLVTGGKVVLLRQGGYAHATRKAAHERKVREERAAARSVLWLKCKMEDFINAAWDQKAARKEEVT